MERGPHRVGVARDEHVRDVFEDPLMTSPEEQPAIDGLVALGVRDRAGWQPVSST
jgi:hypothetical protein